MLRVPPPGVPRRAAGGEELPEHGPVGGQGLGQLRQNLVLRLVELTLLLRHLGQVPEHVPQRGLVHPPVLAPLWAPL